MFLSCLFLYSQFSQYWRISSLFFRTRTGKGTALFAKETLNGGDTWWWSFELFSSRHFFSSKLRCSKWPCAEIHSYMYCTWKMNLKRKHQMGCLKYGLVNIITEPGHMSSNGRTRVLISFQPVSFKQLFCFFGLFSKHFRRKSKTLLFLMCFNSFEGLMDFYLYFFTYSPL